MKIRISIILFPVLVFLAGCEGEKNNHVSSNEVGQVLDVLKEAALYLTLDSEKPPGICDGGGKLKFTDFICGSYSVNGELSYIDSTYHISFSVILSFSGDVIDDACVSIIYFKSGSGKVSGTVIFNGRTFDVGEIGAR